MSGELSEELTVATRLAREAGATIMRVYATDFSVAYKGKGDPVTQADQLANDLSQGSPKGFSYRSDCGGGKLSAFGILDGESSVVCRSAGWHEGIYRQKWRIFRDDRPGC